LRLTRTNQIQRGFPFWEDEMKSAYLELFKDPKWQKKRLDVMKDAGFACANCGESSKTLSVHHGYYEQGKKPWEYPNDSLHCLCDECHRNSHIIWRKLKSEIGSLSVSELDRVLGYVYGIKTWEDDHLSFILSTFNLWDGVGNALGLDAEEVWKTLDSKKRTTAKRLLRAQWKKAGER
jgi:hypothetical protein